MPYRRLPNTDKARITALEKGVAMEHVFEVGQQAASYKTLNEARVLLRKFKGAVEQFRYSYTAQADANRKYQALLKTARLYISHFIQVLNFAVLRSEVRKEHKLFYGLEPDDFTVPDLSSERHLLVWGERLIEGERERIAHRGAPIYNPTIAKVKVHFDIFKEAYHEQQSYKLNTLRSQSGMDDLRAEVDRVILDLWNQVESYYQHLPAEERLTRCRAYGIVYYYRSGEKKAEHD